MTEERLSEMEDRLQSSIKTWGPACMHSDSAAMYLEVLRLARLGLWAEQHGIPALRDGDQYNRAAALAALPKEEP